LRDYRSDGLEQERAIVKPAAVIALGATGPLGFDANHQYWLGPMSKLAKSRGTNRRRFTRLMLGLALMAAGAGSLASCASMAELPVSMGGMPKETPARTQTAPAFPAVYDMPPPRRATALTESERKKAEADLAVIRERQARRAQSLKANPD
jgi:hypothetical protein